MKTIPERVLEDKINKHIKVAQINEPPTLYEQNLYKVYRGIVPFHREIDILSLDEFTAIVRTNILLSLGISRFYEDTHGVKSAPKTQKKGELTI